LRWSRSRFVLRARAGNRSSTQSPLVNQDFWVSGHFQILAKRFRSFPRRIFQRISSISALSLSRNLKIRDQLFWILFIWGPIIEQTSLTTRPDPGPASCHGGKVLTCIQRFQAIITTKATPFLKIQTGVRGRPVGTISSLCLTGELCQGVPCYSISSSLSARFLCPAS
jgi:hypothetical protein